MTTCDSAMPQIMPNKIHDMIGYTLRDDDDDDDRLPLPLLMGLLW